MFSPPKKNQHPEEKQPPWFSFGILGFFGSDKKKAFQILFFLGGEGKHGVDKKGGTEKNRRRPSSNFGPPTQQRRSVDLRMEGCPWCLGELE